MTLYLLLGAAVAVAVAAGYWVLQRRQGEASPVMRFNCPRCGQRLRCGASIPVRTITCPRCLRNCTLPGSAAKPSAEERARRAIQVRRK